jgi:hypothetical protein
MGASAESAIATCVQELHSANLQRMAWGELPNGRSEQQVILELGSRLATDHAALDGALLQYAGASEIIVKDDPPPSTPLERLEGSQFDAAFLAAVDKSNTAMLRTAGACQALAAEPQLRRVLNKTLATYREHEREVERAYRELLPAG